MLHDHGWLESVNMNEAVLDSVTQDDLTDRAWVEHIFYAMLAAKDTRSMF